MSMSSEKSHPPSDTSDSRTPMTVNDLPEHLKVQFREDAKENLVNVQDSFYRISIKGGRYKVNDSIIGDKGLEFSAIILREIPVNIWYRDPYNPSSPVSPDCWSLGGLKPDASSAEIQSESCLGCKLNRFGSGKGADGKRRGKACKNTRRLVLKVEKIDLPVVITLPPTSTKSLNFYLKLLTSGDVPIPVFGVETIFSLDTTVEYPKPIMQQGRFLSVERYKEIKEYRNSAPVEDALKAYATPDDAEGPEEEGTDI